MFAADCTVVVVFDPTPTAVELEARATGLLAQAAIAKRSGLPEYAVRLNVRAADLMNHAASLRKAVA